VIKPECRPPSSYGRLRQAGQSGPGFNRKNTTLKQSKSLPGSLVYISFNVKGVIPASNKGTLLLCY
jgi:hypothetical protein